MFYSTLLAPLSQPFFQLTLAILVVGVLLGSIFLYSFGNSKLLGSVEQAIRFCWNCFLKPHSGQKNRSQQDALESFYGAQASIYDATRTRLLRGREDMLGLVAAQLNERVEAGTLPTKPIWVDVRISCRLHAKSLRLTCLTGWRRYWLQH